MVLFCVRTLIIRRMVFFGIDLGYQYIYFLLLPARGIFLFTETIDFIAHKIVEVLVR